MKIGDEVYIHGYIDEIRKDTVIIKNNGGYFGTDKVELVSGELRTRQDVLAAYDKALEAIDGCKLSYKEDEAIAWDGILWNRALEHAKQAVESLKGGESG